MSEGASAPPLTLFVIATVQARGSSVGVGFTNVGACLSSCMWRSLPHSRSLTAPACGPALVYEIFV